VLRPQRLSPTFRLAAWLVRATLGRWIRLRIEGTEHLPRRTPVILAANHQSWLDPPLVCAYLLPKLDCMISPAATAELFRGPLGMLLRAMGAFAIDRTRQHTNLATTRALLRHLAARPVLIFPEGGIPAPEDRFRAREGVGFLAIRSGIPVIPIAVIGTGEALPPGKHLIKRRRCTIQIGAPLRMSEETTPAEATETIMSTIESLSQRPKT